MLAPSTYGLWIIFIHPWRFSAALARLNRSASLATTVSRAAITGDWSSVAGSHTLMGMDDAQIPSTAALLLSGGAARRMGGADKGTIDVGGSSILDHIHAALTGVVSRFVLAGNRRTASDGRFLVVADRRPGSGPLAGFEVGLGAAGQEWSLAIACDMPFPDPGLARFLYRFTTEDPDLGAVVPRDPSGRLQPLFAWYHRDAAAAASACLNAATPSLEGLLERLKVRVVEPAQYAHLSAATRSFVNVNTPAELAMLSLP